MKYKIADRINGPFGEMLNTLPDANTALQEAVLEGQRICLEQKADDDGDLQAEINELFLIVGYEWLVYQNMEPIAGCVYDSEDAAEEMVETMVNNQGADKSSLFILECEYEVTSDGLKTLLGTRYIY